MPCLPPANAVPRAQAETLCAELRMGFAAPGSRVPADLRTGTPAIVFVVDGPDLADRVRALDALSLELTK